MMCSLIYGKGMRKFFDKRALGNIELLVGSGGGCARNDPKIGQGTLQQLVQEYNLLHFIDSVGQHAL